MKKHEHPWVSREEALRLILKKSHFQPQTETVPVSEALGRVTSKEILAQNTLPNSPTSSMDGIAVKSAFLNNDITRTDYWEEGVHYVFSNTGVGIPDDYDTVILIEDVNFDKAGRLTILNPPEPGQNVRPIGTMMHSGDMLMPAYSHLGPAQLALLTAGGLVEVDVLQKPKVAIIPTGNELVPAGTKPPKGKNVEFNGIMIESQVKVRGGEPRLFPITRDNPDDLVDVLNNALMWADIVILNGGTSKGTDDRAIEALEAIGEVLVYEMDYGPGKHTTLTVAGSKPIVGTVGPTVGAEYAVEWYVWPLINKYLSQPNIRPHKLRVKLLEDICSPLSFDFYARLVVEQIDVEYTAKPAGGRKSPLANQLMANAFLLIPGEVNCYKAGETAEAELRYPVKWI